VDIMDEAVEICKLRLFLKLAAEVETVDKIEPLPDIDFNIRSGNTLVGYVSLEQIKETQKDKLAINNDELQKIEQSANDIDKMFQEFRKIQNNDDQIQTKFISNLKSDLRGGLNNLRDQLDHYLANEYKINLEKQEQFLLWQKSHQPFHWIVEFYGILKTGGFDVVIGNPPYVEYSNVKKSYTIKNYETEKCGNLFANSYERAICLGSKEGYIGFIIPVASVCTDSYSELQKIWLNHGSLYITCYNDRPGKLFDGLEHIRLSIVLFKKNGRTNNINSSKYNKWNTVYRNVLFDNLTLTNVTSLTKDTIIPKIGNSTSCSILEKIYNNTNISKYLVKKTKHKIYYTRKLSGFVQILDFIPKIEEEGGKIRQPSELKELFFNTREQLLVYLAILNSSLFYWSLTVWSDCRNLNQREIQYFPFDIAITKPENITKLNELSLLLMRDIREHSLMKKMKFKNVGTLNIQCIYPKLSKPIIDAIDRVLAQHYGFTDEELDFIINYDIKYRMGGEEE
jgi:methylase of polypeptide subunit release factors